MEKKQKKFDLKKIVIIGLMSAMVFVASSLSISIPTMIGSTRIHFGNVFCILSGLLLGGTSGGLSASIGSMLYDFTNPLYISSAPTTFINKFCMGFVTGKLSGINKFSEFTRNLIASITGAITYVILYLSKSFIEGYFFLAQPFETVMATVVTKGIVSFVNALIAVVVAMILFPVFKKVYKYASK